MMRNTWRHKTLAVLAVLLLSVPSAIGVQRALAPTRGELAGWLAAAGFEAVYLSVALLVLNSELRRYAQRVALFAVGTAIVLNTIADYQARIPNGLSTWATFRGSFDGLALVLSLIESVPLAGLAFAMATLLHRLAEVEQDAHQQQPAPPAPLAAAPAYTLARVAPADVPMQAVYPEPVPVADEGTQPAATTTKVYHCPTCGTELSLGQYGAACRRGYCHQCKGQVG